MSQAHNPYGVGKVCEKIVEYIKNRLDVMIKGVKRFLF